MGDIFSAYMSGAGDDPALFVRPGIDWFHMNAAVYDVRDDSIIVSSREDFLVKIDYRTGAIKWILGDPTKYWYTFPSLRAKALTLDPGGFYPVGQHAPSITSDGLLMVFNNGLFSANQPVGQPRGENRTFSVVSAYAIDDANRTAREAWRFDNIAPRRLRGGEQLHQGAARRPQPRSRDRVRLRAEYHQLQHQLERTPDRV
jgi:hypothetical protein